MAIKYAKYQINDPNLTGTNSADWLWGDGRANKIVGRDGNDNIYGGYGNDTLYGGAGADVVRGADGNDRIVGGVGHDILTGGKHADSFVFRLADTGTDTIRDLSAADTLILQAGLAIDSSKTLQANVDGSGSLDTVLTLSNGAKIILLNVTAAEWAAYAPNVSIQVLTGDDLTL